MFFYYRIRDGLRPNGGLLQTNNRGDEPGVHNNKPPPGTTMEPSSSRRHGSIVRVGTLPTSARRAAAAVLVCKAMRRYEASAGRRPSKSNGGNEATDSSRERRLREARKVTPVRF